MEVVTLVAEKWTVMRDALFSVECMDAQKSIGSA